MRSCGKGTYKALITIRGREVYAQKVAEKLGKDVAIYCNDLPLGLGNHTHNTFNALTDFVRSNAKTLLFLEDDIIFADRFNWDNLDKNYGNYEIFTFYTPRSLILPQDRNKYGIIKVIRSNFFGSQCLLMSRSFVLKLFSRLDKNLYLDTNIQRYCVTNDIDIYTILPNPVEHLDLPSSWSCKGRPHKSIWFWGDENGA